MTKLKIIILSLFILCTAVFAQEEVNLQLESSPGVYINSLTSSNIKFHRSPYGSGDEVSGLTVTHPTGNTLGNYTVTGFSTWEKVRLYINNVYQEWWGTKQVGNPSTKFVDATGDVDESIDGDKTYTGIVNTATIVSTKPYISTDSPWYTDYNSADLYQSAVVWRKYVEDLYGRLASSNTWTGSTNTFEGALFHEFVSFENDVLGQNYEYDVNSNLYLRATQPSNNTVIWKRYLTDNYLDTSFLFWDGSKLRLGLGKGPLYGRSNTQSPVPINTSHFSYSGDQLSILNPLSHDSSWTKKITAYSDSTDGEFIFFDKNYTFKKSTFYNLGGSIWDLKLHYISKNNGSPLVRDSAWVINDASHSYNTTNSEISGSTWLYVDTLTLPGAGLYSLTYSAVVTFPAATGSDDYDTIWVDVGTGTGSDKQLPGSEAFVTHYYDNTATTGGAVTVSWQTTYQNSSPNRSLFIRSKNTTGAVGSMYVSRVSCLYQLIK